MRLSASESNELKGDIPMKPFPCERARFGKGRSYNSVQYQDNKDSLSLFLRIAAKKAGWQPLEVPCAITLTFYVSPTLKCAGHLKEHPAKVPDIDNYVKAFFDSANKILFRDDALVCELHASKKYTKTAPKISFHIEALT